MIAKETLSVADLLANAAARLRAAGVESPRREARLLLAHALGVTQEDIVTERVGALTSKDGSAFEAVLKRREAREPLAYIVGRREFWSLDFAVGPGVLVPRPESEILIEQALKHFPDRDARLQVLDLGTGSGCLLLSFLSERPQSQGLGVDVSQAALAFAQRNAEALKLSHRTRFLRSDWLENVSGVFDVILINPPYIPRTVLADLQPEVRTYEPVSALDGGPGGIDAYWDIAKGLRGRMTGSGHVFFEIGQGQAEAVESVLTANALGVVGTVCDLAGIPRCVIAAPM